MSPAMRMAMPFRHAVSRTRALLTSPVDLVLLAIAAASSPWVWAFLVRAPIRWREQDYITVLVFVVASSWLWPWLLVRPLGGGRAAGAGRWYRVLPMPTLPIGLRSRLFAEAVVGLVLVLALGTALGVLLELGAGGRFGRSLAYSLGAWLLQWSLPAALLQLPVLLAWLAPARTDGAFAFRPLLVAALATTGLIASPVPTSAGALLLRAALVGLGLSALVLLLLVRVPTPVASAPYRAPRLRAAAEPEARLRRDLWHGLLWPAAPSVAGGLIALFGGLLLRNAGVFGKLEHALAAVLAFALLARGWTQPFGVDVFATDALASSRSLFGGAYARAWTGLPARGVAVRRAVYLHGVATAAFVALAFAAHSWLASALGLHWWSGRADTALALAAPCAAAFLLCAATGDRILGALSAAATFSIPPLLVFPLAAFEEVGVSPGGRQALLVGLFLVGAVPPLAHLRRRSSPSPRSAGIAAATLAVLVAIGCRPGDPLCIVPPSRAGAPPPPVTAVDVADPAWMRCTGEGVQPAEAPVLPSLQTAEESADHQPPRPIHLAQPCYPHDAFAEGVQGVVTVELLVDARGRVAEAGVVQSIPGLDAAALDAICRWSFHPATEAGQPVPHVARAPVKFSIN